MKRVNFFGLEFEAGQQKEGLSQSYEVAKSFFYDLFNSGILPSDRGAIRTNSKVQLYSEIDLGRFDWQPYVQAFERARFLLQEGNQLVNWGGDHSLSISTVGAFLNEYPMGSVLWIDAHGDLNLPEHSLTGNFHGMPLAVLLNLDQIQSHQFQWLNVQLKPQKLIYLGIRELDPFEKQMIRKLNIRYYSSTDIEKKGINKISEEILELTKDHPLHISFDVDCICSSFSPSTGIQVEGGLSWSQVNHLSKIIGNSDNLKSIDIVEINPKIGTQAQVYETYFYAMNFLKKLITKGDMYDGLSRADQEYNTAQMESSP